jgi:hypothetical protein
MEKELLNKLMKGLDILENNLDKVKVENVNDKVFKIIYENQNYLCSEDKEQLKEKVVSLLSELKDCPFNNEFIIENADLNEKYLSWYLEDEANFLNADIENLIKEEDFETINNLMNDYTVRLHFNKFLKKAIDKEYLIATIKMQIVYYIEESIYKLEETIRKNPIKFLLDYDFIDSIVENLWKNECYVFLTIDKNKVIRRALALQEFKCIDDVYLYEVKGA